MPAIRSEDDLLALISRYFPQTHPSLIQGRGDDCAELACPPRLAVSTDLFLEDIHFRRAYFSPEDIGYKALAVNLSDLAAAGATPLGMSVGLMAPVPFERSVAEGIMAGMASLAQAHSLALTGGDIARSEKLGFCITVFGSPTNGNPFLRRGPVREGDRIFVLGQTGLARAGLMSLETMGCEAVSRYPSCCAAHLRPTPLVAAGQKLSAIPACSLMDLSDGLARDLPRLLGSCGANVRLSPDVLHPELLRYAEEQHLDPVSFAFAGGEDYALLGACRQEHFHAIESLGSAVMEKGSGIGCFCLGEVTARPGITLNGEAVTRSGFDHFSHRNEE